MCNILGSRTVLVFQHPNQVPYQLGHTRILSYEKMLVVVKYVVKGILPHFPRTFNDGICGVLRSNTGVCNILGSRTDLVFQHPKQALYQTEPHPGTVGLYNIFRKKAIKKERKRTGTFNILRTSTVMPPG